MKKATDVRSNQPRSRDERRRELLDLWNSRNGSHQVMAMFWNYRGRDRPPQAGESVIDVIVQHEYGASERISFR
jgi:hypothetical protein